MYSSCRASKMGRWLNLRSTVEDQICQYYRCYALVPFAMNISSFFPLFVNSVKARKLNCFKPAPSNAVLMSVSLNPADGCEVKSPQAWSLPYLLGARRNWTHVRATVRREVFRSDRWDECGRRREERLGEKADWTKSWRPPRST